MTPALLIMFQGKGYYVIKSNYYTYEPFRLYAPERFELFTTPAAVAACGSCGFRKTGILFCIIDPALQSDSGDAPERLTE